MRPRIIRSRVCEMPHRPISSAMTRKDSPSCHGQSNSPGRAHCEKAESTAKKESGLGRREAGTTQKENGGKAAEVMGDG